MAKMDNFGGGLPQGTIDKIAAITTGSNPPIKGDDAVNILLAVCQEEHEALNPGPGRTGILDLLNTLNALEQAIVDVEAVKPPTPASIIKLKKAIAAVGTLWKAGPVDASFYSVP